jgi:hypothetical protein
LETVDLSDSNPEFEEDTRSVPSALGSSARLLPVVEIPVRRSNRPARQQSVASSKKVQIKSPADGELSAVLAAQFNIVAEAFRTIGEAMGKVQGL